ncbi:MAG: mannose-1-phosphate guanylyltransferase [Bacteroidales bacterium]|nr:mannose-1-phosphate guanylyltransferase [Bacteroidales bacterium]
MNTNNFCIIMAGGTGSRFWPMCDNDHAKQFLDLMGTGETMLQSTFRHYCQVCERDNVIIVTTEPMVSTVRAQIPNLKDYQVLAEPQRRNTAPCIAYAASIIDDINTHANVIVSPSDHAIFDEEAFVRNINEAVDAADSHDWIITIGARPVNPNTKYGYLQFAQESAATDAPNLHKVVTFTEKPPADMAARFIASGEFLWNTGIFVWSLKTLKAAYSTFLPAMAKAYGSLHIDSPREEVRRVYAATDPISADYGVMEKAQNVFVMKANFGWSDVETWDSLYNVLNKDDDKNAVASGRAIFYDSKNLLVHVSPDKMAVLCGLNDYLVTEANGILLVCPRKDEDKLIKYASDVALHSLATSKEMQRNG